MGLLKDILPLALLAAALGALIGVGGTAFVGWVGRKKTAAAHWDALHAEIDLCHRMAIGYFQGGVNLPLSRWPSTFYADSLRYIIAEREIDAAEIQPLMVFYGGVDQINLAFDEVLKAQDRQAVPIRQAAKTPHPWAKPTRVRAERDVSVLIELVRLQGKIHHLLGSEDDENDVYRPAAAIVERHRARFNSLCWRVLFLRLKG